MIENDANATEADSQWPDTVTPFDAASYIHQMSAEMASLAGGSSLPKLAAVLELARDLAAEAMAEQTRTEA
jgi:hypothetical protein